MQDPMSGLVCSKFISFASRTYTRIGCCPLFGSEGFAIVLRCRKDYFGSLLSRYQGHTSHVSWIAVGLRALRPCRNKPEQTGWHKFFLFLKWRSDTSYVTCLSSILRLPVGKCPENPKHDSKQNVNHTKNS